MRVYLSAKWEFQPRLRKTSLRMMGLTLIAAYGLSIAGLSQDRSSCKGPEDLEKALDAGGSAPAYDALGAYFGKSHQYGCAIWTFQSALVLAPHSWEAHYNLGLTWLASGNPQSAIQELKSAASVRPDLARINLALGLALHQTNQEQAAVDEYKLVLAKDPKSVAALAGLSDALIAQGRYKAVIGLLKNSPVDENLQLDLAIAYSRSGDTNLAEQVLTSLVKERPSNAHAHSNLAIVYIDEKRFDDAANEFHEALRLGSTDDADCVSYVKTLIILERFAAAQPVIQSYLQRKPNDFDGLYLSGVVDRGMGDYASAEPLLQRALAADPSHSEVHYNLGFVYEQLGKLEQAKAQLEEALKIDPHSSEARFRLGMVLRALGERTEASNELALLGDQKNAGIKQDIGASRQLEANRYLAQRDIPNAINAYRASITQDPDNSRSYYGLALALDQAGDRSGERRALEKAIKLDASYAPAHNQLGLLSLKESRMQDAEEQFKLAISLDPQFAEAQNNLGVLYGQINDNAAAERHFREATELDPGYAQAYANLGLTLAGESRFQEADPVLRKAIQLDSKNTSALTALAMVLVRVNRGSDAIPYFRQVVDLDPTSSGAHLNLGIALADQFDLNGALTEFSESVRLDPSSATAHYNKGRALVDLRRQQEARAELEVAARLEPQSAESWYLLGMLAKDDGNTAEAVRQFSKAVNLDPKNADARYLLGQELLQKGDSSGAIEQWRKAIEIQPDNMQALYNLSRLLRKTDAAESERLQAKAQQLTSEEHIMDRAQMLGNLALSAASAHDWTGAISQLKEALQVCGQCSALALLHKDLGLIYCHSGDLKDGHAELLEAQKLSPSDPDIAKALQVLQTRDR